MGVSIQTIGPFAAASDNTVFTNQTLGSAGDFTLNGASVSGGVATLDLQRRLVITNAASESGRTMTIYGTNGNGVAIQEAITMPSSATTTTTNRDFVTVTRVAYSGATSGNIKLGTTTVASSPWYPMNLYGLPFNVGLGVTLTGTANYDIEYTDDDIQDLSIVQSGTIGVRDHDVLVAKTASASDNFLFPVRACRITFNSWSSTASAIFYINQQRPK